METYHNFLEHRAHKYIKKERAPSGKWRYYYPKKNDGPRDAKAKRILREDYTYRDNFNSEPYKKGNILTELPKKHEAKPKKGGPGTMRILDENTGLYRSYKVIDLKKNKPTDTISSKKDGAFKVKKEVNGLLSSLSGAKKKIKQKVSAGKRYLSSFFK